MKPQTSDLINQRTQVVKITALLGLSPHTGRHPVGDGTYVYFFSTRGGSTNVEAMKKFLQAKLQADETFPYVNIQQPETDTIVLQLDPREMVQRKIKPAKPVEVRKVPLSELFGQKQPEAPKPVQRFYRVIAIESGVPSGYLVTAGSVKAIANDYSKLHPSDRIRSIVELDALEFVMFSLTGNYEVIDLWNKQD